MSAYHRRSLAAYAGTTDDADKIGVRIARRCRSYVQHVWVDYRGGVWFSRMSYPADCLPVGAYEHAAPRTIADDIRATLPELETWHGARCAA